MAVLLEYLPGMYVIDRSHSRVKFAHMAIVNQ